MIAMGFTQSFHVHWVDTDVAGVMHFSNFFRYFEACEEEFYKSIRLPLTEIREKHGILLPRVEAHCQYKAPCRFEDTIDVTMKIREVAEKTITYDFLVTRKSDEKIAAEGYVKCIAISKEWKAVPLPKEVAARVRDNIG